MVVGVDASKAHVKIIWWSRRGPRAEKACAQLQQPLVLVALFPPLPTMSGRQQRVMVQPIVSFLCKTRYNAMLRRPLECHFQKPPTSPFTLPSLFKSDPISGVQKTKIVIWLYDNIEMRIEGRIIVRPPLILFSRR
jgi:hypothetical protein